MTGQGFTDNGQYTKIFDQWQGFKFGNDLNRALSTIRLGVSSNDKIGFFNKNPSPQHQILQAT